MRGRLSYSDGGWCHAVCPFMIYGELVQRWRLAQGAVLMKWPHKSGAQLMQKADACIYWQETLCATAPDIQHSQRTRWLAVLKVCASNGVGHVSTKVGEGSGLCISAATLARSSAQGCVY